MIDDARSRATDDAIVRRRVTKQTVMAYVELKHRLDHDDVLTLGALGAHEISYESLASLEIGEIRRILTSIWNALESFYTGEFGGTPPAEVHQLHGFERRHYTQSLMFHDRRDPSELSG